MSKRNIARYWGQVIHGTEIYPHELDFFPILKLKAQSISTVLEIGSGDGRMINLLVDQGIERWKFISIDISEKILNCPNPILADAEFLPIRENAIELIYTLGVLEHFHGIGKALKDIENSLKVNGCLIFTVPSLSIYTFFRLLKYYFTNNGNVSFMEKMGKNYSIKEMENIMNKNVSLKGKVIKAGPIFKWKKIVITGESISIKIRRILGSYIVGVYKKGDCFDNDVIK